MLDAAAIAREQAWAASIDACVCATTLDHAAGRNTVTEHTCPHCQGWDGLLRAAGVSRLPRQTVPDRATRVRRLRTS